MIVSIMIEKARASVMITSGPRYIGGGNGTGCAESNDWTCTTIDSRGGKQTTAKFGLDGFLRITDFYNNSSTNDSAVRFIRCENADCTANTITELLAYPDGSADNYDPSMDLGADGFARICYQDPDTNYLMFAQCTNDDCSSIANGSATVVDDSGDVGENASLIIGQMDLRELVTEMMIMMTLNMSNAKTPTVQVKLFQHLIQTEHSEVTEPHLR